MNFLNLIKIEEAEKLILQNLKASTEEVEISNAVNRVLSKDIFSDVSLPAFNKSAVDGVCVKYQDTLGASESMPMIFSIFGDIKMGEKVDNELTDNQCMTIPTGAMLPKGANAVVMKEYVEIDGGCAFISKKAVYGENVIFAGEDFGKGQKVLSCGDRLTPLKIGMLKALSINQVEVYKKPTFAIISTGDELVESAPSLGETININSAILRSEIENGIGERIFEVAVKDDEEQIKKAIKDSLKADIVLISGGSSKGEKDYTLKCIESLGKTLFHGLSVKPGKPTMAGVVENKLIVGLPGHPSASLIVFLMLVKKSLDKLMNVKEEKSFYASSAINFPSSSGKKTIVPITIKAENNENVFYPYHLKSGLINTLSNCDGYIVLEEKEEGIEKGQIKKVTLL